MFWQMKLFFRRSILLMFGLMLGAVFSSSHNAYAVTLNETRGLGAGLVQNDPKSDRLARPLAPRLNGMVFDPATNRLFVAGLVEDNVTVFRDDGTVLIPITNIPVGSKPFGMGLVDNKVYVANYGDPAPSSVSVINTTTLQRITDIPIDVETCGGQASHLAVNPLTHRVYVAMHAVSGPVVVIDSLTDTFLTCVNTNTGAFGIAVHPPSNSIFVGSRDGRDLWRIDGAALTAAQVINWFVEPGGGSPYYVGIGLATSQLFAMVGTPDSDVPNKLFAYNINSMGQLTSVTGSPVTVGNTDDGGYILQTQCPGHAIYIAVTNIAGSSGNDTVAVRNSDLSSKTTFTVGTNPYALAENITLGHLYVGNKGSNTISLLHSCYILHFPFITKNIP